ncbi:hypothetical protein A2617_01790 [Candidatus Daviesbacteria bacterium RIFOXYD1_FULL_41_10]|uniref:Ribonuclease P protein component n=1 Tax=Candidatus Daviesbacteria bacterium RIFOXYD1_FULL_41_10 TaxID=1797801 RepID=A0A1F5MZK3_9BACT|nr:MAG: hypothetical protein A2617_01790 [Candidatus Daviesbacteria bacterium RIFOXYD1_FULL_41_10]
MLPKSKRLNLKKDFKWVASGQKIEDSLMKIFYRSCDPSTQFTLSLSKGSGPSVGIALSTSVFRKAVDRNRARRLTSKAFEGLYDKIPRNLNIVAMPKAGILDKKSGEVIKDLEELLMKNDLLK